VIPQKPQKAASLKSFPEWRLTPPSLCAIFLLGTVSGSNNEALGLYNKARMEENVTDELDELFGHREATMRSFRPCSVQQHRPFFHFVFAKSTDHPLHG
jgi:hypothetical protein